jgi:transposase
MNCPEIVNATPAQIEELLARAKLSFPPQQYELLAQVLATFVYVMQSLQNAKSSIKRLRQMLFGAPTESRRNLLKGDAYIGGEPPLAEAATAAQATTPPEGVRPGAGDPEGNPSAPAPRAGHGRNGAQAYRDAAVVEVDLSDLQPGDRCPECGDGKVYDSTPRTIVKVIGQPPLVATVYKLRQLRCRLCEATFTGSMPEGMTTQKYEPSCATMLAILRYGNGMPFYRLEGMQASLNVPLPDATQWEIVARAVPAPHAAFNEMILQAAQAPLLHSDDTPGKILALILERARLEAKGQQPQAKAINTSCIVAVLDPHQVVLFFTGHQHAGKNLADVLAQRARQLAPPIQMSDALAANFSGEFETIIGKCLTHGRRKVVDVYAQFPEPCRHVIEVLAKIYANDAHTRAAKMSPEQRLQYHQAHSDEPMQSLHKWINDQFAQHQVEPNSALGQALRYLIAHWSGLTLFLRQAGAPLDNNLVERCLKRAILHRKNSMFYKTCTGAQVGDIYMSLIHTCHLCQVNPFDYLQALQMHALAVISTPSQWMPWNFREQLRLLPESH